MTADSQGVVFCYAMSYTSGYALIVSCRIEETSNGAVALQIFDFLFPGVVPMHKVNWGASNPYEFIQNYKLLQQVFTDLKVDKSIEVNRLIRARYQDNLEFMQWLRKFFELNCLSSMSTYGQEEKEQSFGYDAVIRRSKGKGVSKFKPAAGGSASSHATVTKSKSKQTSKPKLKSNPKRTQPSKKHHPQKRESSDASQSLHAGDIPDLSSGSPSLSPSPKIMLRKELPATVSTAELKRLKEDNEKLMKERSELEEDLISLEKERDFYFHKLREVEVHLQNVNLSLNLDSDILMEAEQLGAEGEGNEEKEKVELVRDVLTILYRTEDDEEGIEARKAAEKAMLFSRQAAHGNDKSEEAEKNIADEVVAEQGDCVLEDTHGEVPLTPS